MEIINNVTLNLQAPAYTTVYSPQGQTLARSIRATLLDGGAFWTIPTSALLVIRYAKPDGTIGFYDTLEDGSIAYSYSGSVVTFGIATQALTVPGTVLMQLDFYSGDGEKLSTFTFRLIVAEGVFADSDITSSDYFNVLTAKIAEAASILDDTTANALKAEGFAVGEQNGAAVASGSPYYQNNSKYYSQQAAESATEAGNYAQEATEQVPGVVAAWLAEHITQPTTPAIDTSLSVAGAAADAAATGDAVGDLKSAINGIAETVIGTNKCDPSAMEDGRYTQINDGVHAPTFVSTSDYILTDYIALDDLRYVFAGANYNNSFKNIANGICAFDTNKNSIGSVTNIQAPFDIQTIVGYEGAKYVRVWWKKSDYPGQYFIALSSTAETYLYSEYTTYVVIKDDVVVPQVDAVKAYADSFLYKGIGTNKCDPSAMEDGRYTQINDGETRPVFVSDSARTLTDYIKIEGDYFIGSAFSSSGNYVSQFNGIVVFDSSKNALGSIAGQTTPVKLSDVFDYDDMTYIRAWWTKSTYPSGYMVAFSDIEITTPYLPYSNKSVSFVYKHVNTNPANWFSGKVAELLGDSITQQGRWVGAVSYTLNCKANNRGIGGTTITGNGVNAFWKDSRVNSLDNDSDFVIIMGGTNDAALSGFSIGTISRDNTDTATLCGAYNVLLSKLYYKYLALSSGHYGSVDYSGTQKRSTPKKVPFFICTPIYCEYEGHDNMDDVADAVKKIADMWSIPCIDINGKSGINAFTADLYLSDAMHPNHDGGIVLARAMIDGLIENQPFDFFI